MSQTRSTLLERLRAGSDRASWQEFHAAYEPLLTRYVFSQRIPPDEVPDVLQEIFAKLLQALKTFQYDPQRARFRTWLYRVARNQVHDWRRRRRRRREECYAPEQIVAVSPETEPFDWNAEHRQRVLEFALETVRDKTAPLTWICFVRHHLQRRTAAAIALETGLTENGVYSNAARVLDRVRKKCLEFDEVLAHAQPANVSQRSAAAPVCRGG